MILQFGAGNFLRGFADLFVEELDRSGGASPGPVVIVQSTGRERADLINRAGGRYHLAIQGLKNGRVVDETIAVTSVDRARHAGTARNSSARQGPRSRR